MPVNLDRIERLAKHARHQAPYDEDGREEEFRRAACPGTVLELAVNVMASSVSEWSVTVQSPSSNALAMWPSPLGRKGWAIARPYCGNGAAFDDD